MGMKVKNIVMTVLGLQLVAAQELTIEKIGTVEPIPIAIEGISGELLRTLMFDLEVMSFKIVSSDKAQYIVKALSNSKLEANLIDRISGQPLFSRVYEGGNLRTRAHALADDIVSTILGVPGIARTKIAFRKEMNGTYEIFVADYDGYNAYQITFDNSIAAAPAWVPRSNRLYYVTYKAGNADIVLHDLGSGERRFVARYSGSNISPSPSPDGKQVAMILSKAGSPDLYVADWDGSNLRQLTATSEPEASPTWSPNGQYICYSTIVKGRRVLAIVPSSGGTPQILNTIGITNPSEPDWSPDGRWIIFTAQMGRFQICIIPAKGGEARVLVEGEDPVWAPNSRTVIFVRSISGKKRLSLLDVFTKQIKDLPIGLEGSSQPTWAR